MTEFEFIERPDSCPSIVKMWVLLEGSPSPLKLKADITKVSDLDDFKGFLKHEYEELTNVRPQNIVFLHNNNTLKPSEYVQTLANTATAENPLVVRYPLSEFGIKAILKFVNNRKEEVKIKYTTGSFDRLQSEAKDRFEFLTDCNLSDIYFEHQGEKIEDAYHFTSLVEENITKVQKKVLSLDLKVLIRNRKPFSDWKLDEVLKNVYNYDCGTLESVSYNFDMENLPQLSPSISDEELNKIIEQLNDKKLVFDKVNINEATAREFISVILVNAVLFVKKNNDSTATLMVEKQFVGSHGYGPFDYVMMIRRMFVLVTEAKPHDPEKGIAQNLAQIDSLSETLGKRKFDQAGIEYESMETMPIIGIVTTGRSWIFIRHTSQTGSRQLEVSSEYECKFMGNDTKDDIKVIVSYVVRLLQAQVSELDKRKSKRSRI